MCGFVLTISKTNKSPDVNLLARMNSRISHRGPDQNAVWTGARTGVAFSRLAIHDLSADGSQPMFTPDRSCLIVFNGEVYNFIEIRAELEKLGHVFQSKTDTEVILASYLQWGVECVHRFMGMFAFAIVDTRTEEVFIARDHLGIKPLFRMETADGIFFASEIKAFLEVQKLDPNTDSFYEQLHFRYVAGTNTPFKGVHRLDAGTWEIYEQGKRTKHHKFYSTAESFREGRPWNQEEIEQKLLESIQLHTRSDVGYNLQLSGGVDSSYVTAVLAGERPGLKTYSVALNDSTLDESPYQKMVSEIYRTEHFSHVMGGQDFVDNFQKAVYHMDLPVIHYGCVFLMKLCYEARQTSKVILTGEGADELFGGYSRYKFNRLQKTAHSLKQLGVPSKLIPNRGKFKLLKEQMESSPIFHQQFLKPEGLNSLIQGLEPNLQDRYDMIDPSLSPLAQQMAYDQGTYLSSLLERQDKLAMAASVEARVPFCNHWLFQGINPLPDSSKIKNAELKSILKVLAARKLPSEVVYRKKIGLTLPLDAWFRKGPATELLDLLTDQTATQRPFYQKEAISRMVDEHRSGKMNHGKYIIGLLSFELWYRTFFENYGGYANAKLAAP